VSCAVGRRTCYGFCRGTDERLEGLVRLVGGCVAAWVGVLCLFVEILCVLGVLLVPRGPWMVGVWVALLVMGVCYVESSVLLKCGIDR